MIQPSLSDHTITDVVVLGSGAGGLTAAITARFDGLDVVILEKASHIGGTSAISGGALWIPGNSFAKQIGLSDSVDDARMSFDDAAGEWVDDRLRDAYLRFGPEMVDFLEQHTEVKFAVAADRPDYHHPQLAGSSGGGRTIFPLPLDSRTLGVDALRLRPPLRELTFLGLMIRTGPELAHFVNVFRSFRSAAFVIRKLGRYGLDVIRYGRSTQLLNGNALVGRLLKSALDLKIPIFTDVEAVEIVKNDGRARGVVFQHGGKTGKISARAGVVLACGGFPHAEARQKTIFPHVMRGGRHVSPAPKENTGDGLAMGERAGGIVKADLSNAAGWLPVSLVPRKNGRSGVFPHLIDRQKPGFIAVTRQGVRFTNEADSYHVFCEAMIKACTNTSDVSCFLIGDHRAVRKYGMGFAKPSPVPLAPYLASGYLLRGSTITDLAKCAGIDPVSLETTIKEFNASAINGDDPAFGRGTGSFNRYNGDLDHTPNPCVAPLLQRPFYAVQMFVGEAGTYAGLATDERGRVLSKNRHVVSGLYAVGNDMRHVMGGAYLGGGATLGPAMTFGYIAGRDLASAFQLTRGQDMPRDSEGGWS